MPRLSDAARAERRDAIVASATELFARRGYHATSMSEIIEHTRFSAGSIYQYFGSKDALIVATAQAALDGIESRVLQLAQARPVPDLRTFLARVTEALPRDVEGALRANLILHSWAEAGSNEALAGLVRGRYRAMMSAVHPLVDVWQGRGELDPTLSRDEAARLLLAIVQGTVVQSALLQGAGVGGASVSADA
jgi:AcrR family transcriptional regulator